MVELNLYKVTMYPPAGYSGTVYLYGESQHEVENFLKGLNMYQHPTIEEVPADYVAAKHKVIPK